MAHRLAIAANVSRTVSRYHHIFFLSNPKISANLFDTKMSIEFIVNDRIRSGASDWLDNSA